MLMFVVSCFFLGLFCKEKKLVLVGVAGTACNTE